MSPTAFHTTAPDSEDARGRVQDPDAAAAGDQLRSDGRRRHDQLTPGAGRRRARLVRRPYRLGAIPADLISAVRASSGRGRPTSFEATTLIVADTRVGPGHAIPGLRVGVPVGSDYELYYLFPLTRAADPRLVQRAISRSGSPLAFLLAAIASLVTRRVVVPVRQAAQTPSGCPPATWPSACRCGVPTTWPRWRRSFNDMAASLQQKIAELEDLSHVQRQFVSDVSHELRTPLTTIRIAADVLFAPGSSWTPPVRPLRRAVAEPARPVRVAARRPAGDQPVRRQCRDAGRRTRRHLRSGPGRRTWPSS